MPSFCAKQSGFTSHSKSEPNGQPRNNESMSIVTCRGDQTYGLCKSGITYVALIVAFLMISDSGSRLESYFMLILLLRSVLGHRHHAVYRKIEFSAGRHASTISEERRTICCCVHTFSSSAITSLPERTTLMAAALSEF